MDPVLIGAVVLILMLIAAYVIYKVLQRRREKEAQARLNQLPEAERQVQLAARASQKSWGCLSAFSGLALVANSLLAVFTGVVAVTQGDGSMVLSAMLSILGAVCAGFIYWRHKRWAVYGYGTLVLISGLINGVTIGLAGFLQAGLPLLLLYAAAKPVWDLLEPPKTLTASGLAAPVPAQDISAQETGPGMFARPDLPAFGPRLEVVTGERAGSVVSIHEGFTIGRGPENQLRLMDPRISAQHVRLRCAQGSWFAQDQNSTGGMLVNGSRVPAARLNPGDRITLGGTDLIFRL